MYQDWMEEMPIIITINGKKYVNGVEVKEYKVEKSIGGTRYMLMEWTLEPKEEYIEYEKICPMCGRKLGEE